MSPTGPLFSASPAARRIPLPAVGALLLCLTPRPVAGQDLEHFRHRIATDREAGLAEGWAALEAGTFSRDPSSLRMLLWFMGGAAVGDANDQALADVRALLDEMAVGEGDVVAGSLSGFLHAQRLLDLGEVGQGLVSVLEAANAIGQVEDAGLRRIITGELCRGYSGAGRLDEALEHCRRHRSLVEGDGDAAALARARYLEASVLSRKGEHREAILAWEAARQGFLSVGLDGLAARTSGGLAADLVTVGEAESALPHALTALEAAVAGGSATSIAIAGGVVGEVLLQLERPGEARAAFEEALAALEGHTQPGIRGYLLRWLEEALLAEPQVDVPALAEVRSRQAELATARLPTPEEASTIETLEQVLLQRELDLRIRELEQEARIQQLELQTVLTEAERQEALLRAQRTTTTLMVVAASALALALVALLLLLRSQRNLAGTLRTQALRDELTGLPNRRALSEAVTHLLEDPEATQRGHALLLVDVDHFKRVNDQGGHPFGDTILVSIARRMQAHAPPGALVARLGGEEFALLAQDIGHTGALELAESVRAGVEAEPFSLHGRPFPVTVSVGVALYTGGEYADWMGPADAALYRAKGEGRNRVVEAARPAPTV